MAERFGILACAGYVPRNRLPRAVLVAANEWLAPAQFRSGGERSFAGWDEDPLTLAVEAARGAVAPGEAIAELDLASTSFPFDDRCHAGLVGDALGLADDLIVQDLAGHRRAASSALVRRLKTPSADPAILVAADAIDAQPGSRSELESGHGAAALKIGTGAPIAELAAGLSRHSDLVDRYRAAGAHADYMLEERWARDEGLRGLLDDAVRDALAQAGVRAAEVDWLVLPVGGSEARKTAERLDMGDATRADKLFETVGFCGAAHPLIGLVWTLEQAQPGQHIVVTGFGQGVDVLVLKVGPEPRSGLARRSLKSLLRETGREENYTRYLALRGLLRMDTGIRSERDNRTAMSTFYRKREAVTRFVGGRCKACGTLQFPAGGYCVECRQPDTLEPESLADLTGWVKSFTEDWLAYTPKPPLMFGSVGFPGGASVVMEFSDFEPGTLTVGLPVRMAFRIKDFDTRRRFRRYFWKPVPMLEKSDG